MISAACPTAPRVIRTSVTGRDVLRGLRVLEPITIEDLADRMGTSRELVQSALKSAVERGLARRRPIPGARFRTYVYRTTALGRADCECGRPKEIDLEACARCLHLDGDSTLRGSVIQALRGTDGMNLRELVVDLGLTPGNSQGERTLRRPIADLLSAGRIRRFWRDGEGGGCWAYALNGRTEREWND